MTVAPLAPPAAETVVRLTGDLDFAAAPAIREQLIDVLHHGIDQLVIDLSGVLSCDTAGLAVLVGTQRRASLVGTTMRLVAPSPSVTRVLRATGLDRTFSVSAA